MGVGMLPLVGWRWDNHSPYGAIRAHQFVTPSILRWGSTKADYITATATFIGVKSNCAVERLCD